MNYAQKYVKSTTHKSKGNKIYIKTMTQPMSTCIKTPWYDILFFFKICNNFVKV